MALMKAVIIKGNPQFVDNNPLADEFYKSLGEFMISLGYEVSFDKGEPYTEPEPVELWIGHSRGADRLRFAPKGTIVIGIGVPPHEENNFPVINHPEDKFGSDPNHYILTEEMKDQIKKILGL